MKVKSKVNTKRLVKGAIYDVVRLRNKLNSNSYLGKTVKIKLNDSKTEFFTVNNFTMEDDSLVPQIDWDSPDDRDDKKFFEETTIREGNIQPGDYVMYLRNTHSHLIQYNKYKVQDISVSKYNSWADISLKLEGSNKFYKSYSFRKCTKEEVRKMSLNLLFDGKSGAKKVTSNRKFDLLSEDEKREVIIKIFFTAYLDKNRNTLSLIDWAINKTGEGYKLNKEDFEPYLDLKMKDIFSL